MPNIENVNGVGATSIDKINRVAASSIQSVDGQDLVTFEPAIYSTVTGNLSAGTFNTPPGAAYVSVIAVGAGGGTANPTSHTNAFNQLPTTGAGGAGAAYCGSLSVANINTMGITLGAGAVASTGGTTTVTIGNMTLTANGGAGGSEAAFNSGQSNGGAGGSASGGNVNKTGAIGGEAGTSNGGYGRGAGRNNETLYGCGGGGGGGWGTGSNTNHSYRRPGGASGYGNSAVQNGINQGSQTHQAYLFGGRGGAGGSGGNGYQYNSGSWAKTSNPGSPGSHEFYVGSYQPSGTSGDNSNSPTSGGIGNLKHANTSANTRKGGGGAGGHAGYGGAYNNPVVNGTGNAGSAHVGILPQAGAVIIYAYTTE